MKQLNLLITSSFLALSLTPAYGAYHVTKETNKKTVLIEELTGVECSSCPKGDELLEKFQKEYGDQVAVIQYHVGGNFQNKNYNYTTEESLDFYNELERTVYSYPCAWISRHHFPNRNTRTMQVDFWAQHTNEVSLEDAPVNLWMYAFYDVETGKITVDVEGFFIENVKDETAFLTVVMTQNGIVGKQAGVPKDDLYNYTQDRKSVV